MQNSYLFVFVWPNDDLTARIRANSVHEAVDRYFNRTIDYGCAMPEHPFSFQLDVHTFTEPVPALLKEAMDQEIDEAIVEALGKLQDLHPATEIEILFDGESHKIVPFAAQ